MDNEILRKEYELRVKKYERLKDEVIFILENQLKVQQIPIHEISSRIKTFDSFTDKVARQHSEAAFETINDICGIRVVCLFLSDLGKIGKIIEEQLNITSKDDKIYTKPDDAFGYLSIHYIGTLPVSVSGPRYNDLKDLKFEIQLRTIAMHAWATISHYLDYKSPNAIPSDLRKDFNALSALFYVADSHFELFSRLSQKSKLAAEEKAQSLQDIREEEINLNTLSAYLVKKYPNRKHVNEVVSELVEELVSSGYTRISQLDEMLKNTESVWNAYEKSFGVTDEDSMKKNMKSHSEWGDVAIVRICLTKGDPKFVKFAKHKYLSI